MKQPGNNLNGGGYDELAKEAEAIAIHLDNHATDLALYGRPAEREMVKEAVQVVKQLAKATRHAAALQRLAKTSTHAIQEMLRHPKPIHGFVGVSIEAKLYDAALALGRSTLAELEKTEI